MDGALGHQGCTIVHADYSEDAPGSEYTTRETARMEKRHCYRRDCRGLWNLAEAFMQL